MNDMHIVIVEDEAVTARNLAHLLQEIEINISIVTTLSSVGESVNWFIKNPEAYDLIFMDIRLADGLSFDIFQKVTITRPVIFVTAYNDYAIQAFKNNGIDYILKPFDEREVDKALKKFRSLSFGKKSEQGAVPIEALLQQLNNLTKSYKKSFLVHFREKLIPVETAKIAWFYTANEIVYAKTLDIRQYVMEFTMEQLEQQVDPQLFFRANRQFIINRSAITEVDFYFNGRLSVKVKPEPAESIIVSKARVPEFKSWMNK
jgi:DNA-binding LytR/AlgR family response regulator